jgi:selenocysteine lyase/cysteine desulfurase
LSLVVYNVQPTVDYNADDGKPTELQTSQFIGTMVEHSISPNVLEGKVSSDSEDEVVYLNNAGQAKLDPEVQAAGVNAVTCPAWEMNGAPDQRRVRQLFASIIQADETDISIMPSTAFAITLAAKNIHKHAKQSGKILILQDQFCSAVYPWQDICDSSKGHLTLEIVPYPEKGQTWTDGVLERLDDNVVATCLPPLHWADGALLDLSKISRVCRNLGIWLIVDATQAVGAMPCTIPNVRPHMMACSVHKWLRSASGASLCYVSPEVRDIWEPLDQHGHSRDLAGGANWDAAKNEMDANGYPEIFFDDARKFDSGGKPNPILMPMLRASLEQVAKLDFVQVQEQLHRLMAPLIEWALSNGYTMTSGDCAYHLFGIRPSHLTTQQMIDLCSSLQQKGIYVAVRCGAFRVSPYIDNVESDIQRLISALEEARHRV